MEQLKRELRDRYLKTYKECAKFKYFPNLFLRMITSEMDIVDVTRHLIYKDGATTGFARLFEAGRMDLSVEKIILEPKFRPLFAQEDLQTAFEQLRQHKYPRLDEIEVP